MQEYADPVIDWLDAGRGIISRRLFREVKYQIIDVYLYTKASKTHSPAHNFLMAAILRISV